MPSNPKYYIIEASALPDVFLKVADAKRLLDTGEVASLTEATRRTGISRSAFYKYRDAILRFHNMMIGRIITLPLMLNDEPGVLSAILGCFARHNANILTINQTIPTNACALGTVSAETAEMTTSLEEFLQDLGRTKGVSKADVLAG